MEFSVRDQQIIDEGKLKNIVTTHRERFSTVYEDTLREGEDYQDVNNTVSNYQRERINDMVKEVLQKSEELAGDDSVTIDYNWGNCHRYQPSSNHHQASANAIVESTKKKKHKQPRGSSMFNH